MLNGLLDQIKQAAPIDRERTFAATAAAAAVARRAGQWVRERERGKKRERERREKIRGKESVLSPTKIAGRKQQGAATTTATAMTRSAVGGLFVDSRPRITSSS